MRERLGLRATLLKVIVLGLLALPVLADEKEDNSAVKPEPRKNKEREPDKGWMNRHKNFVQMAQKGGIELLFLGDSITDAWGGEGHGKNAAGSKIFVEEIVPLHAANFGIGGDRTQHVLWRLQNGELEGIQPKVLMLMIGTNNLGANTAEQIADGIKAIVKAIHERSAKTKVLLLGIFPRGPKPNPQRDKIKQINTAIAKLDDGGKTVKYLDIGGKFLEADDTISKDIMPDYLHLSAKGYRIWADAVKEPIKELLGKK
jgi:lysophospholipase L1-like esterase